MSDEVIVIDEPIHRFFGLSYASYLVLPRTVLQSMPPDWQRRLVSLMHEVEAELGGFPEEGSYTVNLRDDRGRWMHDPLADYERGRRRLRLIDAAHLYGSVQSSDTD